MPSWYLTLDQQALRSNQDDGATNQQPGTIPHPFHAMPNIASTGPRCPPLRGFAECHWTPHCVPNNICDRIPCLSHRQTTPEKKPFKPQIDSAHCVRRGVVEQKRSQSIHVGTTHTTVHPHPHTHMCTFIHLYIYTHKHTRTLSHTLIHVIGYKKTYIYISE